MIPELPAAVPEIPVSDITAAAAYYRDHLSFSLDWVAADIALAGVSRDDCRLFLAGPPFREERGN
ncbi:MAG: VOC family protein, partial [Longimicrobiales bacterium]